MRNSQKPAAREPLEGSSAQTVGHLPIAPLAPGSPTAPGKPRMPGSPAKNKGPAAGGQHAMHASMTGSTHAPVSSRFVSHPPASSSPRGAEEGQPLLCLQGQNHLALSHMQQGLTDPEAMADLRGTCMSSVFFVVNYYFQPLLTHAVGGM